MTTTMSLRLYLIRHGETAWSLSGQHTGRTDIPLIARGEDEAKWLGLRLQAIRFAHVLTSPRQRARRTCELVGLGPRPKSNRTWRNGTMAITKECAPWTFARRARTGIFFATVVQMVKCRHKFLPAPIGSSPASASWTGTSRCSRTDNSGASWPHDGSDCRLGEAQHFLLGTASLSILGCDPHHPEVPVIALWNEASHEMLDLGTSHRLRDKQTLKQQAIERWENEGGEIPNAGADV